MTKIKFYKVLSYWDKNDKADYKKEPAFDSGIFESFKNNLHLDKKFVGDSDKILFIFKKYSGEKDFIERPIKLTAGLYANRKFNDLEKIYGILEQQIDVFDENSEYIVEVDEDLFVSNKRITKKKKSIRVQILFFGVLAMLLGIYWFVPKDSNEKVDIAVKNVEGLVKKHDTIDAKGIGNILDKNNNLKQEDMPPVTKNPRTPIEPAIKIKKWKWDRFCKAYIVKNNGFCYEEFIKEKCKQKHEFKLSYRKYAKEHADNRDCKNMTKRGEDMNLQQILKEDSTIPKRFF